MFHDKRSKKVVLVAHCVLNQNSKIDGCAHYPGAIREVTQLLLDAGVGIIQMPCPEIFCLGIDREVDVNISRTIESEDTRVAELMREEKSKFHCQEMTNAIIYQIEEYRKHGFQVIGLVGINGSPTCGVNTTWLDDREYEGRGIFIEILEEKLKEKDIDVSMVGIKARDKLEAVSAINRLFRN